MEQRARKSTLLAALLAAWPLGAHHNPAAEFDLTKPVALTGVVTKAEWINPHAWLHINAKDSQGNVVPWLVELASPNFLKRAGVTMDSFKQPGEVMVEVWLAKDGARRADARQGGTLTLASGRRVILPNVGFSTSGKTLVFESASKK